MHLENVLLEYSALYCLDQTKKIEFGFLMTSTLPRTPDLTYLSADAPRSVERFPTTQVHPENSSMGQSSSTLASSFNVGESATRNSTSYIGESHMNTIESLQLEAERKDRLLEKLNLQLREREEQHDRDMAALSEMQELLDRKEEQISELALAVSQKMEAQADNALTESLTLNGWDMLDTTAEKQDIAVTLDNQNLTDSLDLTVSTPHSTASSEADTLKHSIRKLQFQLTQRDRLHRDTELSNQTYREEIQHLRDENAQYQTMISSQADEIQILREQQLGETEELAAMEEEISVLRTTLADKLRLIESLTAEAQLSKTQLMEMKDAKLLVQHSADIATAEIETATEEITTLRVELENERQKVIELQAALDHEKFASKQKTHEYTEVLTNLSHSHGVVNSLETQIQDMETHAKIKDEEIEALQLKCKSLQMELDETRTQLEKAMNNATSLVPSLSPDELATILSDNNRMLNMLNDSATETEALMAANEKLQASNGELKKMNAELIAKMDRLSTRDPVDISEQTVNKSAILEAKNTIISKLELELDALRQKYTMMEKSLNEQLEAVTVAKVSLDAENSRLRTELQSIEPPTMSSMNSATSISIVGGHSPGRAGSMSSQVMGLNTDITRLQNELRRKDAEIDNMSTQIATIMEEILTVRQANMSLEQDMQSLSQEAEYHKNQASVLEKTLTQTREELRVTLDKTRVGELIEALNGKTAEVTKLIRVIEDKNAQIKDMQIELDGRALSGTTGKVMQATIKNLEEEILRLNQELELVVISNESLESRLHSMGTSICQPQTQGQSQAVSLSTNLTQNIRDRENNYPSSDASSISTTIKMRQLSDEVIALKDTIANLTTTLKQKDARLEEVSSELSVKYVELDNMRGLIKKKNEQLMQLMK